MYSRVLWQPIEARDVPPLAEANDPNYDDGLIACYELTVGEALKDEYDMGYFEKLCLNVKGNPKWPGDQGRLELYYDEQSDQYRAIQPVTVDDSRLDSPLADETAALDIGANNLVACTTTTGQ